MIKWTFQHSYAAGGPPDEYAKKVIDRIMAASGGRLVIDFFPGGAVVPATEEADALRTGTLDYAYSANGYNQHLDPAFPLFDQMAGGLSNVQLKYWLEAGGGYELAEEGYSRFGIVYVASHLWSPEDFAYTKDPINTVDDIKKLKMRTAGVGGEILSRMGAATVFLPGGELYESMQRGVINAFEYGGAAEAWDNGFHEVMNYLYISLSRAPSDGGCFIAREESWNALPDDLKVIVKYVQRAATDELWEFYMLKNAEALQKIKDYGVNVQKLPKEVEDAFMATAAQYFDEKIAEYGEDSLFARVVKSMRAFKKLAEEQGIY